MTARKVLAAGLVVLTLVLLVGVGVARLVGGDDFTRQMSVFAAVVTVLGLVVSLGKNAYDVWDKERERRKKDAEKAERIRATPIVKDRGMLAVELYNEGNITVHIKRVTLVVMIDTTRTEYRLITNEKSIPIGPAFLIDSQPAYLLTPKEYVIYHETRGGERTQLVKLLDESAESLWVEIESFEGVVARIPGSAIHSTFKNHRP